MGSDGKEPLTSNARGPDGLYPESDFAKMGMGSVNFYFMYAIFTVNFALPGIILAAVAIFLVESPAVLEQVAFVAKARLAPIFLSIFVFQVTIILHNANLSTHRRPTCVNVPDQHVYRVYGGGPADKAFVFMCDEGEFGAFNRAQRALGTLEEALPLAIAQITAAGIVFPWASFVAASLFGIFRVKAAIDYTKERTGRLPFSIASNLMISGCLGANLVVALTALLKPM